MLQKLRGRPTYKPNKLQTHKFTNGIENSIRKAMTLSHDNLILSPRHIILSHQAIEFKS